MNFERGGQPLATFLFAGQTGVALRGETTAGLDERIAVTCVLNRFSEAETGLYIQHRMTAAGAKRTIFDVSAVENGLSATHRIPRRINRLCDLALLVGYGEELHKLTGTHIESIHQELIGAAAA